MQKSTPRLILGFLVAVVGIYLGIKLGAYSEADDAPGGIVIAALIMFGSLALGLWIALRRPSNASISDR